MDPRLQRLQNEIASAVAALSPQQMSSHPLGKWSVSEILAHLYLTYTGTVNGFERVEQAGKSLATAQSWKQRGRAFVVVGLRYLPSGRESPSAARPRGTPSERVLAEIASKIAEMDAAIARCEVKLGPGSKLLDHPVLGPLTGSEWRKFHLVHGRHHIKQIQSRKRVVIAGSAQ